MPRMCFTPSVACSCFLSCFVRRSCITFSIVICKYGQTSRWEGALLYSLINLSGQRLHVPALQGQNGHIISYNLCFHLGLEKLIWLFCFRGKFFIFYNSPLLQGIPDAHNFFLCVEKGSCVDIPTKIYSSPYCLLHDLYSKKKIIAVSTSTIIYICLHQIRSLTIKKKFKVTFSKQGVWKTL